MNRGAKLFLALAGAATGVGVIIAFTAKSAKASTLPPKSEPEPGVVVTPEPGELGPPIVLPDPPPDLTLDVNAASRALLRWWAAEGESLLFSEEDREVLRSRGFPVDFGSEPSDLSGEWSTRKADMAAAFERLNGLSPADGAPSKKLFDALARWVKSQELPEAPPPSSPTEPVPQIITAPGGESVVVVPEPSAPPVALPQGGPPPFVPPMPQAAPQEPPAAVLPPLAVPVVLPTPEQLQEAVQAAQGAAQAALPVLASLPPLPAAPPAPVLVPVSGTLPDVTAPTVVSSETAELVAELLAAEATNNWKRKSAAVTRWQQKRGLKADGQFGPKTALAVAREVGTLPIVRYWPAGSQPHTAVPAFRGQLLEIAATAPEPRASQLRLAAQREDGQGFGNNQKALPAMAQLQINQVA